MRNMEQSDIEARGKSLFVLGGNADRRYQHWLWFTLALASVDDILEMEKDRNVLRWYNYKSAFFRIVL